MITHKDIQKLVEENSNDMKLGQRVRQLYSNDTDVIELMRDNNMRHLLNLQGATVSKLRRSKTVTNFFLNSSFTEQQQSEFTEQQLELDLD